MDELFHALRVPIALCFGVGVYWAALDWLSSQEAHGEEAVTCVTAHVWRGWQSLVRAPHVCICAALRSAMHSASQILRSHFLNLMCANVSRAYM